jgi:hypothetical protein
MNDVTSGNSKNGLKGGHHMAVKNVAIVQCDGFRCLAYRDMEKWRDFQSGKELPDVKNVVFTFSV